MIGYSGDIQTAGFQQNLSNKIKYGGQFFFNDYSVVLELGPLSKDKGFCFCKKQTTTTTNEGKRKGGHPFCRSRKPLLQSYEYKMAYEYEFKQSSPILNDHLSQKSCLFGLFMCKSAAGKREISGDIISLARVV